MELNQECIRDLLIYIEQFQKVRSNGLASPFKVKQFCLDQNTPDYAAGEVALAVQYLTDKKLIECHNPTAATMHIQINRITGYGYDYLGVIRDNTQWGKIRKKFGKIFDSSAPVLVEMIIKGLISTP